MAERPGEIHPGVPEHWSQGRGTASYGFRTAVRSPPLDAGEEVVPLEADGDAPLPALMLPWPEVIGVEEPPVRAVGSSAPPPPVYPCPFTTRPCGGGVPGEPPGFWITTTVGPPE
jgi:hypothetical protein